MGRWKVAAAAAHIAGVAAALVMFAPGIHGQDRRAVAPRAERLARVASWFGGQIGVTVSDAGSSGVVVDDVRRDGPAEKAGVKTGDVIMEFDGERVRSSRQFARLVDETPQGKSVKMALQRAGQRTVVDVTPESREFGRVTPIPMERFRMELPEIAPAPLLRHDFEWMPDAEMFSSYPRRLGVQVEDLGDQLAEYFGVKRGALVTAVSKDSPAARAGFKAGDVITRIAAEAVADSGDVRREIRRMDADKEFDVEVMRDRKAVTLKVKLDPPPASSRKPGTATDWF